MWLDCKYALRLLLKSPKFTALILFVIVGGLFVSLYTFSFLNSAMYKELPLPDGGSIFRISSQSQEDNDLNWVSAWEAAELLKQQSVLEEAGRYYNENLRLSIGNVGQEIYASYVESNFFQFAKVPVLQGRALQLTDYAPGASPVVVLSYKVWSNSFNQSTDLIGQTIKLNNQLVTVVGIMPEEFAFPVVSRAWLPLPHDVQEPDIRSDSFVHIYARLKKNISPSAAEQQLSMLLDNYFQQRRQLLDLERDQLRVAITTFATAQMNGDNNLIFGFINGVAICILLLACINVGNLLLARALERNKETAIRGALGAPGKRLIIQLMWEGTILSVIGAALAVLLTGAALSYTDLLMQKHLGDNLAFWWRWGMDAATLLMAILFTLFTLFFACFIPAYKAANQDINQTLRDGTRGAQGQTAGRLSRFLVTLQIFLISILMLIGGLSVYLTQSFIHMDFGVDFTNIAEMEIALPEDKYPSPEQRLDYYLKLKDSLTQRPEFSAVSIGDYLGKLAVKPDGRDYQRKEDQPHIDVIQIIGNTEYSGPYLTRGRLLDSRDHSNAIRTAIISESMANRYWPNQSALSQQIEITEGKEQVHYTIVGVVTNRMNSSTIFSDLDKEDEIYISGLQGDAQSLTVEVKHRGNESQAEQAFFDSFYQLNPILEPGRYRSKHETLGMIFKIASVASNITFICAFFALFLALTGIYGLSASSVVQRFNEIGIRRAVGATDNNIIRLFMHHGSKRLFIGIGAALVCFGFIAWVFHNFTEQMVPLYIYPFLSAIVIVAVATAVLMAIYFPIKKAIRLEPSEVLRYE